MPITVKKIKVVSNSTKFMKVFDNRGNDVTNKLGKLRLNMHFSKEGLSTILWTQGKTYHIKPTDVEFG